MPDESISDLWWLNRSDWRGQPDTTAAAFKMGADLMQRKRDNAMKAVEFNTQQKAADARLQNTLLDTHLKELQIQDATELKKAQVALQTGEEYEPAFSTHLGALSWKSLKGQSLEGQAQQKLYDDYLDVIGYHPTAATSLGRYKRFSPEWGEALQNWKNYVDVDRSNKKALLMQEQASLKFKGQTELERLKTDRYLDVIHAKELAGAYLKNLGGRAPNKDTFIKDMARTILGQPGHEKMSADEASDLAESIWQKHVSAPTTSAKTLKWNPDTQDFE